MTGVPEEEITASDFVMVRAALVKRLGGANEALVWSRIEYRSRSAQHAHKAAGMLWWKASYEVIAEETGLSRDQVKRAIAKLVEGGFLVAQKQHGNVQTVSYSPVIIHRAESPDGTDSIGRDRPMQGAESPDVHRAESPDAPLIETRDLVQDTPVVPRGDAIESAFERIWDLWPSARRGSSKKAASSFRTAVRAVGGVKNLEQLVAAVRAFCEAWATWPASEIRFVPLLTTWLNQERWTTPLPEPRGAAGRPTKVDQGRAAHEELLRRQRERDQRAVAS